MSNKEIKMPDWLVELHRNIVKEVSIYSAKHPIGDGSQYKTKMLYEINDERIEAANKAIMACYKTMSERMKWREIETAPRVIDKDILLYVPSDKDSIQVGRWSEYSERASYMFYGKHSFVEATHWLPIPDAPMGGE